MSLTTAIRDGRPVQWVAKLTGTHRTTGAATTVYYTMGVNYDGGTVEAPARITTIGEFGERLPDVQRLCGVVETGDLVMELDTAPLSEGEAGALRDEVESVEWSGGAAVLYLVPVAEPWSAAEEQLRTVTRGEPEWQGERAYKWELESPETILDAPVRIASYVGIPTCWQTITMQSATASSNGAYDVEEYTVSIRFRWSGSFGLAIYARQSSENDRQFMISAPFLGAGRIRFTASSGGTAKAISLTSVSTAYADDEFHSILASVAPGRHAYLMIDGEVVAEDQDPATPDVAANAVTVGALPGGASVCDARMYPGYMAPEEARAEIAQRSDTSRAVLMIRFDDGAGSTATDYSATGNDATISGIEDTDWEWAPSDLGEPELAGRPYPLVGGLVVHAPAHRIDAARERYRVADIAPPELLDMRQRGDVITASTWSDEGDGVIEWTAAADQPVTQSRRGNIPSLAYPGAILERLISAATGYPDRGGPTISAESIDRYDYLIHYLCGTYTDERPRLRELAQAIIGEGGGYLVGGRAGGEWDLGYLLPPVGPGPYHGTGFFADDLGVLSFPGGQTFPAPHVDFGDTADLPAGSHTLAVWYKSHKVDVDPGAIGGSLSPGSAQPGPIIATKLFGGDGYHISQLAVTDDDPRALSVVIPQLSTQELRTPPVVQYGKWALLISVWDSSAGTWTLYHGVQGASGLQQVAQATSVTGSPGGTAQLLKVGGNGNFWSWVGSIAHFRIFSSALTSAQRLNLFDPSQGSPSIVDSYAPMTEGSGEPVEVSSGATGTLTGVTWAPEQTIDLRDVATLRLRRRLRPARSLRVAYARNFERLSDADLSGSVTDAERQLLTQEQQWVSPEDPGAVSQPERQWLAPWLDDTGAHHQARIMSQRTQGEHWLAAVEGHDLRGVSLRVGSEVVLTHPEIETGVHWRVIDRQIDPVDGTTSLALWR